MKNLKKIKNLLLVFAAIAFAVVSIRLITHSVYAQTSSTNFLNGKIAFDYDGNANNEIYTMNADGSSQTRLTNNAANDFNASWSFDGGKIAFYSMRDGNNEIYTMNADGSSQTRLTNNAASDVNPAWSSSTGKIAFSSNRDGGGSEIYTMNADGSSQTRLTNNAASDDFPAWSLGGSKIAFSSGRDGNWEIYTMNPDGSSQTRLTNNASVDYNPAWSPDGSKIAFSSNRGGTFEIYTMNADGSSAAKLTNTGDAELPAWSPDGKKIVFTDFSVNCDIYTMNADGSSPVKIAGDANCGLVDTPSSWQPLPYSVITYDDGSKTSTIEASLDYSIADYEVASSENLVLNGKLGNVVVADGGRLSGNGTVTGTLAINSGGKISPGSSPGCLSSGNLTLTGTYEVEIGGTAACTGYDQTKVSGSVNIDSGKISATLYNGYKPKAGETYTIIDNDGADAVAGTFLGLPEGATFKVDNYVFKISYKGGSGNDVSLKVVSVPGVPDTGFGFTGYNPMRILLVTILTGCVLCAAAYVKSRQWTK